MAEPSPAASAKAPAALARWRKVRASLREHLEQLAQQVDEAAGDREFMAMLDGAARLWRYSPFNQFWIRAQRPGATSVRGRREWEAAGRPVLEGEQQIIIFAPRSHGQGSPWPAIGVGVFDIAQTKGGKVETPNALVGAADALPQLQRAPEVLGVEVEWMEPQPIMKGRQVLATSSGGVIQLTWGLSDLEVAMLIAHELAHELLHTNWRFTARRRCGATESVRETEAHGTAYVVLTALGLPCAAPRYIAWRGGRGADILRSLDRMLVAARLILAACEGRRLRLKVPTRPTRRAGRR